MILAICLTLGFLIGTTIFYIAVKERLNQAKEASQLKEKLIALEVLQAQEKKSLEEKISLLEKAELRLSDTFKAISFDILKSNNQSFLQLAQTSLKEQQEKVKADLESRKESIHNMVKPIKESLQNFDKQVKEMENSRASAYSGLTEQIKNLLSAQLKLENQTNQLSKALRDPNVRGSWGEMQLKRTVEAAGMLNYVDFEEQINFKTKDGQQRPDMIINLPNNRHIIVDAKTPSIQQFLEAIETQDVDLQQQKLKEHAKHVKENLIRLSSKKYAENLECSPEFVVLFLPSEMLLSATLQADPQLIEFGARNNVILATPTTLIALLKAVAYGWKQEEIAKEAKKISELGGQLYKRLDVFFDHFGNVRKNLLRTVDSYNKTVSSLESRVIPVTKKFRALYNNTGSDSEYDKLETLETLPKPCAKVIEN